jgi:hypothetical protein
MEAKKMKSISSNPYESIISSMTGGNTTVNGKVIESNGGIQAHPDYSDSEGDEPAIEED